MPVSNCGIPSDVNYVRANFRTSMYLELVVCVLLSVSDSVVKPDARLEMV